MNMKKSIRFVGALVLAGLLLIVTRAWANPAEGDTVAPAGKSGEVSGPISYQGRLLNNSGQPVNGMREMTFRLYSQASGGIPLWLDVFPVPVEDGLFTVNLAVTPELFDGRALWLGIQVGGEAEMMPRQLLQPAPYALHAASIADGAVTANKIGEPCVDGQVLAKVGETWSCADAQLDLAPAQQITQSIQIEGLVIGPVQADLLTLGMSTDVITFTDGLGNIHKMPGTDRYSDLALVCLEPCNSLNEWYAAIRSGTTIRHTITVTVWSGGGIVGQQWYLYQCWPSRLNTALSADGHHLLARFALACEDIEWSIP